MQMLQASQSYICCVETKYQYRCYRPVNHTFVVLRRNINTDVTGQSIIHLLCWDEISIQMLQASQSYICCVETNDQCRSQSYICCVETKYQYRCYRPVNHTSVVLRRMINAEVNHTFVVLRRMINAEVNHTSVVLRRMINAAVTVQSIIHLLC